MQLSRSSGLLEILTVNMVMITHVMGGPLDPPPEPDRTHGAMYTLEAIYQRLAVGTTGGKRTAGFAAPAQGPTASTGHTLDEVMAKAPEVNASQGATPNHVLEARTFWCLQSGYWGTQTGTMTNQGSRGYMPGVSNVTLDAGYYNGNGSVTGDVDLVPENIKKDVVLFGVTGTYEGEWEGYPSPVPRTGQSDSDALGDDGDLGSGVVWPTPRFISGSGTNANIVVDNLTGLMWTKHANMGTNTLEDARDYCEDLSLDGYDDWRLPNVRELHSLCDFGATSPALPSGHPFDGVVSNHYWSSTSLRLQFTTRAWAVNMSSGDLRDYSPSWDCVIWPVRGGP